MSDSEAQSPSAHTAEDVVREVGERWDRRSLADHWDETREVTFEVTVPRQRRIALDPDIYARVETQARKRGVSPETLVNLYLSERVGLRGRRAAHRTSGGAAAG